MANNYDSIYTFQAMGAELRSGVEHMIERYLHSIRNWEQGREDWWLKVRRPLAVSGLTYAFFRDRPEGEQVEASGLEAGKLYRVAVSQHVLNQSVDGGAGPGYLGWLPKIELSVSFVLVAISIAGTDEATVVVAAAPGSSSTTGTAVQ